MDSRKPRSMQTVQGNEHKSSWNNNALERRFGGNPDTKICFWNFFGFQNKSNPDMRGKQNKMEHTKPSNEWVHPFIIYALKNQQPDFKNNLNND